MQAAATPTTNFGVQNALEQGGVISISVFTILVLMSIFSFYILFTKLMQQQKIISQGRKVRSSFWNSPNLREASTKLEARSADRCHPEQRAGDDARGATHDTRPVFFAQRAFDFRRAHRERRNAGDAEQQR